MSHFRCILPAAFLCAAVSGTFVADRGSDFWYGGGTTAVLMRSPRLLFAGIDSRETYLQYHEGKVQAEDREVCKAARLGPYYALVAGLDRGSNGYDALREVGAVWHPGESLDELAAGVEGSVAPPLISLLSQIRTTNPSGFIQRFTGQVVLQLSLLGVQNRVPEIIILEFTESENTSSLGLSLRTTRCPGDCSRSSTAYFLGAHDEIDDAVLHNPKLIAPPSGKNVGALIDLEKLRRPDIVGGPVAIIGMDQSGVVLVNPGACAPDVLGAK
jgi:hypothetical protein